MSKLAFSALGGVLLCVDASPPEPPTDPTSEPNEIIRRYCVRCHGDRKPKAELTLKSFDVTSAHESAEIAEKVINKLRAGMMPPAGARRPEAAALADLATAIEQSVDAHAAANPNPGRRTFQRLNRAEYARSIKDLVGLDVDVTAFLPPDTISQGFDNIADVQGLSPTLMEGYLRAADKIARLAVGDPEAGPADTTYKVPRTASQLRHVEGAPFGTRGGISVIHNFPADGEYVFKIMMHSGPTGFLFGMTSPDEKLEVSVDGKRVALLDIDPRMHEQNPKGMLIESGTVEVRAGPHRVSAAFVNKVEGPVDDLIAPIEHTLADTQIGSAYGITTVPHLRDLIVSGPNKVTGVSDTPSRRKIFTRRPISPDDELACATEIITRIATQAYRRPLTRTDIDGLMSFYQSGKQTGGFEAGVRTALQATLASPHFVFRLESVTSAEPGQNYRIEDLDLAARLSFFLWGTGPDRELVDAANRGELGAPGALDKQLRRMLADDRAEALGTRFASQWLRLQDLFKVYPDALNYPQYDRTLAHSLQRETELLFEHIVRENRSVLELLTADYTFVDERVAKHYGIDNVNGSRFRRVTIDDDNRRGLLGHASILTQTSHANRTSPVLRGKWVMEVLLGNPPPPPPPNVPDFDETEKVGEGRLLTVRERLAEHRSNRACKSCHDVIDPIGLALENFDVTGAWRIKDAGVPVDPSGELYDGTPITGPVALRDALLSRREVLVRNLIKNLMAYALGRRVEYYDMPTVRAIARKAAANHYRAVPILLGIVESAAFRMSRAESKDESHGR